MLDLNLIYTFLEVARAKKINIAARRLNITQPAVSQRIKALEDQVGKSLFLRRGGMELNAAGKELYSICEKYIENVAEIDNWVKYQKGYIGGDVSVMTPYGPVGSIFAPFLEKFLPRYEDINLEIMSVEASHIVENRVLEGEADLGIIVGPCHKPSLKVQTIKDRMIERAPNATRLMDKLCNKNLIERIACEGDRRVVHIQITENGVKLLEDISEHLKHDFIDNLTEEEASHLSDLLDKIR